jgi:hypothetical protein
MQLQHLLKQSPTRSNIRERFQAHHTLGPSFLAALAKNLRIPRI